MSAHSPSRRRFLRQSSLLAAAAWAGPYLARGQGSPSRKLNVGFVGIANRGGADLQGVSAVREHVNVAALCDVDEAYLAAAKQRFPGATTYHDFRRMLDQKDLDAVVVGTPDHTHAIVAMMAMRAGRHVYCEKPLARTVSEVRAVTELARQSRRVTQIGTQIHAGANYRRVVELVRSGAIGPVTEVHVWVAGGRGGLEWPSGQEEVPAGLHYDLWLGPVPEVPYHAAFVPRNWRDWWVFAGGTLGDFGCHYMDLPFWALELKHPRTISSDGPPPHPHSTAPWQIVRYEFPRRGQLPPVNLTWYHGGRHPEQLSPEHFQKFRSGVLFVGAKGQLLANYGSHVLLPEADFRDFVRPAPFLPGSIGHHREWVMACLGEGATTCGFDYSGPLTETALLGNVAHRVGQKLVWDAAKMRATNCPAADDFIRHRYRPGWSL